VKERERERGSVRVKERKNMYERKREGERKCVCQRERGGEGEVMYWSHRLSYEGTKMEGYLKPVRQRSERVNLFSHSKLFCKYPNDSLNLELMRVE